MKSHCLAPDFEDQIWARSKEEAARKLKKRYPMALAEFTVDELTVFIDLERCENLPPQ